MVGHSCNAGTHCDRVEGQRPGTRDAPTMHSHYAPTMHYHQVLGSGVGSRPGKLQVLSSLLRERLYAPTKSTNPSPHVIFPSPRPTISYRRPPYTDRPSRKMTNQYVLLVVHQKPVAHKAHANAFIFFPVARNFPPLPILAGSPPLLFFFFSPFSFPSPFFYFKFHRSGFNGFLPSPLRFEQRIQARRAPVPLEFQRW